MALRKWTIFGASVLALSAGSINATTTMTYDAKGRLTTVVYEPGKEWRYTYDAAGNRTRMIQGTIPTDVPGPSFLAAADFDQDGRLGSSDLALLRGAVLSGIQTPCGETRFDLNADGSIDHRDIVLWLTYAGSSWIPGDWVGPTARVDGDVRHRAPDNRVDFFDLAALVHAWQSAEVDPFFDLVPSPGAPALGSDDLARFTQYWLTDSGSVGASCLEGTLDTQTGIDDLPLGSGELLFQPASSVPEADGQIDIAVTLPTLGVVAAFRFVISASALDDAHPPTMRLGSADAEGTLGFCDVRRIGDGWLIAGAQFTGSPARRGDQQVLCTLRVPSLEEPYSFEARGAAYSSELGTIRRLPDSSGSFYRLSLPSFATLRPTFPNPFRSFTAFDFAIPRRGPVGLRVHDASGRLVRVILDGFLPAGWHRVEWDGQDGAGHRVPAGIYFLRLQTSETQRSRKIVILR